MTFFSTMQQHFPDIENNKIETDKFLKASLEVVRLIEMLGTAFAPVRIDLKNNVEKIYLVYNENETECRYLQDMVLFEKERNVGKATLSLQWLRRGLHLFLHVFECVVTDHERNVKTEDLTAFVQEGYAETLQPYHGWMTQKIFHLVARWFPNRTQFFKYLTNNNDEDNVVVEMKEFNTRLRNCITNLIEFYQEHGLETTNRV